MRSGALVHAEEARETLLAAVAPWLDSLTPQFPAEAHQLRALVAVQIAPVMGRLILVGEEKAVEVARATAEDLPGAGEISAAADAFIAAGLSAAPPTVTDAAFEQASKHGAGFVILLDPLTGSARCLLAPRAVGAERWIELFGISPERETTH